MLTTTFRRLIFALLLAACCPLFGCGAVFIPKVQSFPDPIRKIVLSDAQTGTRLTSARVTYRVEPYSNWIEYGWFSCESKDKEPGDCADATECITVIDRGDGEFVIPTRRKLGWVQWFFPIPSPLGWNLYRGYEAVVYLEANGYHPFRIRYLPCSKPGHGMRVSLKAVDDLGIRCILDPDGTLTIGMCPIASVDKTRAEPAGIHRAAQPGSEN